MVRLFWFAGPEIFQNKRNVLRDSPKFPTGISKRQIVFHSLVYCKFYLFFIGLKL